MMLKIAIIGTRGIPNNYGGFEEISEYLSVGLVEKGHDITVYNSHNHPYKKKSWQGVKIVHQYDPEYLLGTSGQFIYDFNCILHARRQNFDVILFMGYTSSSVWATLFPKNSVIISNMDGLEWKREKYSRPVQFFLKHAEKWAIKNSHYHIADSQVIQSHLQKKYQLYCNYIPYGASVCSQTDDSFLTHFGLTRQNYLLLIARMEPENNVQTILEGFHKSSSTKKLAVIGNTANRMGSHMLDKYQADPRIIFLGSIFNKNILDTFRAHCYLYFHGHSVGGTNPSLLEAMAGSALIAAHANDFNKAVLGKDAYYFSNSSEVKNLIEQIHCNGKEFNMVINNKQKIRTLYSWEKIINEYNEFICRCYEQYHQ